MNSMAKKDNLTEELKNILVLIPLKEIREQSSKMYWQEMIHLC